MNRNIGQVVAAFTAGGVLAAALVVWPACRLARWYVQHRPAVTL